MPTGATIPFKVLRAKIGSLLLAQSMLITFCVSCRTDESRTTGEKFGQHFHELFNEEQHQQIDRLFDEPYRGSVSAADNEALFAMLKQKMGDVTQSRLTDWEVNLSTFGRTVILQYTTRYANGSGDERFILGIRGQQVVLLNYDVKSPLLMEK